VLLLLLPDGRTCQVAQSSDHPIDTCSTTMQRLFDYIMLLLVQQRANQEGDGLA
jgi:hypothetical protein